LSSATYDPFGPATGWTWGNSTASTRAFDKDGNPSQIVTAGVTNGYTIDNASRITGLSDSGLSSNSFTFGYDLLDRVTSGTSTGKTRGYTYDANSNQLTTTGTVAFTDTIASTSNRLSSTTGGIARTYGYDPAGNTTSYTGDSFTFNDRGRMSQAIVNGSSTNYIYNALGQLIEKSGNGGTTLIVYDEAGHILGEYTSTGALIEETIWMGDTPVATLLPNGSGISIYYVHSDHLGTPRKVTRPSDNGLMWRWDPDTFGSLGPNTNPAGLGTFIYNLRFPGQYALPESGLYYNYLRDYDPQTGRYIESDSVGLRGGINTYTYVESDPVNGIDPFGRSKIYGNWCGPDWSGGYPKSWTDLTPREQRSAKDAIDPLDAACMKHDKCYDWCRMGFPCQQKQRSDCFKDCDKVLTDTAFRIAGWWGDIIGTAIARPGNRNEPNAPNCPSCTNGKQ
jgi:RHS repeat-associated protein